MQLGALILPDRRWADGGARWRRAEDLGFDHAWTYDHLTWRTLRDAPWFAAIPTLVAAAMTTNRIRLGPLVSSAEFRHPVPYARELLALDDLSGGRMTVGLGAGSGGWDATVLGSPLWSTAERSARFEEFASLLDRLLRQEVTDHRGRFYDADGARSVPGPVQRPRPPFAIAATGPRGMRLAAVLADLWVTTGDRSGPGGLDARQGAATVARQVEQLEVVCDAVGRDPRTLRRLVVTGPLLEPGLDSADAFRETIGRYEEVGVTDLVVHWPRREPPYEGDLARFERAVAAVR